MRNSVQNIVDFAKASEHYRTFVMKAYADAFLAASAADGTSRLTMRSQSRLSAPSVVAAAATAAAVELSQLAEEQEGVTGQYVVL